MIKQEEQEFMINTLSSLGDVTINTVNPRDKLMK